MVIVEKIFLASQGAEKKINVYATLKNAIQFLDLKPGSVISESQLIEELGVSRTPIREALIRLSDELLIHTYPQRGTYVSKIDLSLAKEGSGEGEALAKLPVIAALESHPRLTSPSTPHPLSRAEGTTVESEVIAWATS